MMESTERDIRTGLIEEAELTAVDTLCVVLSVSDISMLDTWEILSITGPFLSAVDAIAYGEQTCAFLKDDDPIKNEHVRYQLRALFPPE